MMLMRLLVLVVDRIQKERRSRRVAASARAGGERVDEVQLAPAGRAEPIGQSEVPARSSARREPVGDRASARPRFTAAHLWRNCVGIWRITPPAPRTCGRRDDRRSRRCDPPASRSLRPAPRGGQQTSRSGPTRAQPARRRARHRPATTGPRATPRPSLAVAGSRRSDRPGRPGPGTEPSQLRLHGAPARPTPLDAAPAPIAPAAAAPCGPARPACQSGSSKARRAPPCTSGTNAQASRARRAAQRPRCRGRWPNANASSARPAPHGAWGTTAPAMPSNHSTPRPASLMLRSRHSARGSETGLHWGCKENGGGVRLRLFVGAPGQFAGHRNDLHLRRFPRPAGQVDTGTRTREAFVTRESAGDFSRSRNAMIGHEMPANVRHER